MSFSIANYCISSLKGLNMNNRRCKPAEIKTHKLQP